MAKDDEPQNGGEYQRPDAEAAFKIYDNEIKPKNAKIATIKGDLSDPHKRIKDNCNFPRSVLNFIVALEDMEDHKRDHHLLALHEGFRVRGLHMPSDLVTQAQGNDGGSVVPIGERERSKLATLQMGIPSDGSETDLAEAGEDEDEGDAAAENGDDFEEATEEELAAQEGRSSTSKAKAKTKADAALEAVH